MTLTEESQKYFAEYFTKRKTKKPKAISFKSFKEMYRQYILDGYIQIVVTDTIYCKRISVSIRRHIDKDKLYLEKKVQETIVRNLKKVKGFNFYGDSMGFGEYIKIIDK